MNWCPVASVPNFRKILISTQLSHGTNLSYFWIFSFSVILWWPCLVIPSTTSDAHMSLLYCPQKLQSRLAYKRCMPSHFFITRGKCFIGVNVTSFYVRVLVLSTLYFVHRTRMDSYRIYRAYRISYSYSKYEYEYD